MGHTGDLHGDHISGQEADHIETKMVITFET